MWTWIKSYRLSLLVFFLLAFRPQLVVGFRRHVLVPAIEAFMVKKKSHGHSPLLQRCEHRPSEDDGCGDDDEGCSSENDSEYYRDDAESDGCSDEDDSCAEPSSDSYDEPSDGCADDGSCAESNTDYAYDEGTYSDDGCSCTGESVVGSAPVTVSTYTQLSIRLEFARAHETDLRITDVQDGLVAKLTSGTTILGAGFYYYSWDGKDMSGLISPYGTYIVVLRLDRLHTLTQRFTFSKERGFLVVNDNRIVFSDTPGKIMSSTSPGSGSQFSATTIRDLEARHFQN